MIFIRYQDSHVVTLPDKVGEVWRGAILSLCAPIDFQDLLLHFCEVVLVGETGYAGGALTVNDVLFSSGRGRQQDRDA